MASTAGNEKALSSSEALLYINVGVFYLSLKYYERMLDKIDEKYFR